MQIQGQIQSVKAVKSGSSNGRNWTIYEVVINGQKFRTFEAAFQNMIGQSGTYEYEVQTRNVNGKNYQNNTLSSLSKKAGSTGGGNSSAALQELNAKLDKIISLLENPGTPQLPDGPGIESGPDDIDVSDIPF